MTRLHEILEDQLAEARAKAGTKIIRKLQQGLRVELLYFGNDVRLTIARDNTYPSMKEWETIVKFFPYPIPNTIEPVSRQEGSRCTLTARFASQRVMQMKFE
jgi:hypothetical protein